VNTRIHIYIQHTHMYTYVIVTGITKTTNNHEKIISSITSTTTIATGTAARESNSLFQVKTMDDIKKQQQQGFDHVVFCAPPSGFEDYAGAVQDAITTVWSGPEKGGSFVFTSSGGMCVCFFLLVLVLVCASCFVYQ